MTQNTSPLDNQLLASLMPDTQHALFPRLKKIDVISGSMPGSPSSENRYAYFPATCIVSTIKREADGKSMATAMIGHEGMVGINFVLNDEHMPVDVMAQQSGIAFQLLAAELIDSFNTMPDLRKVLLCYTLALMEQISQNALYNRCYRIDQQLCRWIMLSLDRLNTDTLVITQDGISHLLGVRREGVSEATNSLQRKGAIECQRGRIKVLDRSLLKALSEQDPPSPGIRQRGKALEFLGQGTGTKGDVD